VFPPHAAQTKFAFIPPPPEIFVLAKSTSLARPQLQFATAFLDTPRRSQPIPMIAAARGPNSVLPLFSQPQWMKVFLRRAKYTVRCIRVKKKLRSN
jgi:hypothetical protein